VGNLLYVTDVDSVKVVDAAQRRVLQSIALATSGRRADTACADADHNLLLVATPESSPPRLTLIDTATRTVRATVMFSDVPAPGRTDIFTGDPGYDRTTRLGQCRYDPVTDSFYLGRVVSPNYDIFATHGELVALPGPALRALQIAGTAELASIAGARMDRIGCLPTGLALGPGRDIAIGCRGAQPVPGGHGGSVVASVVLIVDRTNGTEFERIIAGGGGQLEYDVGRRRYYNAAHFWEDTAREVPCTWSVVPASNPCTPSLFVIDSLSSRVGQIQRLGTLQLHTGKNAQSVAVDPVLGKAFVPVSPARAAGSCTFCSNEEAGLLTFTLGSGAP
jgi:hypothetical protein